MRYDKSKRKGDVVVAANAYHVEGYPIQKWVRNTVRNMTVLGEKKKQGGWASLCCDITNTLGFKWLITTTI